VLSGQVLATTLRSSKAEPAFSFDSIRSLVDVVSPRLAHVTRIASVRFAAGNWSYFDWGLWYEGRNVQVTNASDATGKLAFIYPLPGSDPTKPVLRIIFSRTVGSNQSYSFTYQYDVTSDQDSLTWSETLDASQVLIQSLTIEITLPANYQPTGVQPSSATQSQDNGRTVVSWTGTDLIGVSDVGLTVGFAQQSATTTVGLPSLVTYAAVGVCIVGVGLYGFTRLQTKRKKRRVEPYAVLEKQAKEAAVGLPRDFSQTGVAVLDYLLNGGLPAGSATVITAPTCDERDMILRRILETGARTGEVSIYVGKDVSKVEDLLDTSPAGLQLLVTKVEGLRAERPQIHVTDRIDNLNGISIDLMALLQSQATAGKSKRLCLDLIDDLLLVHKSTMARRWLTTILTRVKALGYTVIATLNPQMHSPTDAQAILDLFDGHIQLEEKVLEGKTRMVLRVQKMFRWRIVDSEAVLDRNRL